MILSPIHRRALLAACLRWRAPRSRPYRVSCSKPLLVHARICRSLKFGLALGLLLLSGCDRTRGATDPTSNAASTTTSGFAANQNSLREQIHDFGLVKPGEVRTHTFHLSNTSKAPLVFDTFKSSCNCTGLTISKKRIEQGESFKIEVTFHPANKNYDAVSNIVARFRKPNPWIVPLRMQARVRQPLSLNSSSLTWSSVGIRDLPVATFQVRNYSDTRWRGLSMASSQDWLSIRAEPATPDDGALQTWTCTAQPSVRNLGYGSHSAFVTVRSEGSATTATLPVKVDIDAPVVLVPNRVFHAPENAQRTQSIIDLKLIFRTPSPPEASSDFTVESNLQDVLRTEFIRSEGGNWILRCHVAPAENVIRDEFLVKIPSLQTTIVVPVFIAARPAAEAPP